MDPMNRQPQAQNAAQNVTDKVTQAADDARAKTTEVIDTARQKSADAAAAASDRANDVMTAAGDQMTNLAQTVRERVPAEGRAGDLASTAADTLERSGRYLQEADPQAVRTDLERIIREHPIESMLVGLGVGYLFARTMRR